MKRSCAKENSTRYRARIELSGRDPKELSAKVGAWAQKLDIANPAHAQAMLECLWCSRNSVCLTWSYWLTPSKQPNRGCVLPRFARWTLGRQGAKKWETLLATAAKDESPLVRAEAVKAAVDLGGLPAAEAFF